MNYMLGFEVRTQTLEAGEWHSLNPWLLDNLLRLSMWLTITKVFINERPVSAGCRVDLGLIPKAWRGRLPSCIVDGRNVVFHVGSQPYSSGRGWTCYMNELDCCDLTQFCDTIVFFVEQFGFEVSELPPDDEPVILKPQTRPP